MSFSALDRWQSIGLHLAFLSHHLLFLLCLRLQFLLSLCLLLKSFKFLKFSLFFHFVLIMLSLYFIKWRILRWPLMELLLWRLVKFLWWFMELLRWLVKLFLLLLMVELLLLLMVVFLFLMVLRGSHIEVLLLLLLRSELVVYFVLLFSKLLHFCSFFLCFTLFILPHAGFNGFSYHFFLLALFLLPFLIEDLTFSEGFFHECLLLFSLCLLCDPQSFLQFFVL